MTRLATILTLLLAATAAATAFAAGPFTDVPAGHWAHEALAKCAEAKLLEGWGGRFHGGRSLTRYQAATVIARMLERLEGPDAGKLKRAELENLEALTIEFADELALLNVKVSSLEDSLAALKADVATVKTGSSGAGISGLFQARLVVTDDDPNGKLGRGAGSAGTGPISRYVGAIPTGAPNAANSIPGTRRAFFNVAQASVGFDRHFDEEFSLHMQLDFDADQEANFWRGPGGVQVNEAYVDMNRLLFDGDARLRAGLWALPFSRERNPEMAESPDQLRAGFRTLDLTVTPTLSDQTWEQVRLQGVGLRNGKDSGLRWQVGVTSTPNPGAPGTAAPDGSLLNWRGSRVNNLAVGSAQTDAISPAGLGFGQAVWGDVLQAGRASGPGLTDHLGAYGWVGDRSDSGLRWDAGYFTDGGSLGPSPAEIATPSSWSGLQLNLGWWGWQDWGLMGSYFAATSESANAAGAARGSAVAAIASGLVSGVLATGLAYPDLDSRSWSFLVNRKLGEEDDVTARYEHATDEFGPAEILARIWTLGWNHRVSSRGLFQLEWSLPSTESQAANATAAGYSSAGVARNTFDVNDRLLMAGYKVRF